ncbi:hypothetical protein QTP88_008440 [Uroleucon formosanum]
MTISPTPTAYPTPAQCLFMVTSGESLGLALQYSNDDSIREYLTCIFCLLFLNPAKVGDMFSMELAAIQPLDDKITQFSDYLVVHIYQRIQCFHLIYGQKKVRAFSA